MPCCWRWEPCNTVHLSRSLHPVYKTDGALGYHGLWHALFYQLQYNPDWDERYAASYGNAAGDTLPQVAAQKYVLQHPPAPSEDIYLTPDHSYSQMKARARETYIRKAFLEFVANDPKFVIATFADNVKRAGTVLMSFLSSLGRHPFLLGLIVAVSFLAGAAILACRRSRPPHPGTGAAPAHRRLPGLVAAQPRLGADDQADERPVPHVAGGTHRLDRVRGNGSIAVGRKRARRIPA